MREDNAWVGAKGICRTCGKQIWLDNNDYPFATYQGYDEDTGYEFPVWVVYCPDDGDQVSCWFRE